MLKNILIALSLIFTQLSSAAATEIDLPYTSFKLDNGLTLIVHEDHKAPIVAVSVWYHVGSKHESPDKTGFAHLFEHLMFNGSENYDDEYFKPLEEAGASNINGTTNNDRTNYYQVVPTSALKRTLWLESDRMGHLLGAITQEKLDEQRDVVKNEKRSNDNRPYGKVWALIGQHTYPANHPYSWPVIGSMEHLDNASLGDVKNWFQQYYGPANATIVLAGDITPEQALKEVKHYFGDISSGQPAPQVKSWPAIRQGEQREQVFDHVPRSRIYMVWNTPGITHQDADLLDLATSILGGGKTSRLYQRLVQEEQLATSVHAFYYGREIAGQVWITADAKPGVPLEKIEQAINEELNLFIKKGPSKKELALIKTSMLADIVRSLEVVGGSGGKSGILAYGQLFFDDPGYFSKSLAFTEKSTRKMVKTAANTWLSDGRFTLEALPLETLSSASKGADRSKLPDLSNPPAFHTPDFQRAELENGLKILLLQRNTTPLVEMTLQFNAGYAADKQGKLGGANFTLSMLKDASHKLNSLQISQQQAWLGAEIGTGNSLDTSMVTLSALTKNLSKSMALFADISLNPLFSQTDIKRKKDLILASIESEKSNPISVALRTLPPLLYGNDQAYGIPFTGSGTTQSVKGITQQDLIAFHQTWFRPDNATLLVVGDTSLKEITQLAQDNFGKWKKPDTQLPGKKLNTVALPEKSKIYLIDKPGAPQSMIIAGHLAPSPNIENNTAISLMNSIFGGNFSSRINTNLREDKGWSYGAGSSISSAVGQRPLFIYAPVQSDKTAESMQEILLEINHYIHDKPATQQELQAQIDNRVLSLPGQFETSASLLSALGELLRHHRPDDYIDTYKDRLNAVTLETLQQTTRDILKPEQLTWVIVGDIKLIEEKIRALNIGEITIIEG